MIRRIAALIFTLGLAFAATAQSTTFTYQGSLDLDGSPATGPLVQSRSEIVGQFTLAATSTILVQHFTKTVKTVNGLGIPAGALWNDNDAVEVYTIAEFWKIR